MTNELKQLIAIIRKSNNLRSDEKALSLGQLLHALDGKVDDFYIEGKIFGIVSFRGSNTIEVKLDLTKEDLDQQSPETLSQLLKLLNNEHLY